MSVDFVDPGFAVDANRCVRCGRCVEDCVVGAIEMPPDGTPALVRPEDCLRCQHCLAVCPAGAVSIFGHRPETCVPADDLPAPAAMERLMRTRRSYRHFLDEDLPADLLRELVDVAWSAPTGVNSQLLHFSVLATRSAMGQFRARLYERVGEALADPDRTPGPADDTLRELHDDWRASGRDDMLRGAPHLVLVSASAGAPCGEVDPVIALSYLELYAQTRGVGTVWCGFAMLALRSVRSRDLLRDLGVPKGYRPGYAMLLGRPRFGYARGVRRGPAEATFCGL